MTEHNAGRVRPPTLAWVSWHTVVVPRGADAAACAASADVIRGPVPRGSGRLLHRELQPGNVLFDVAGTGSARITGVVGWAAASWGPADLDVAHCSVNLALLHGSTWGLRFGEAYGVLAAIGRERLYWPVRDALACSEEMRLEARPWREAGRTDLTSSGGSTRTSSP